MRKNLTIEEIDKKFGIQKVYISMDTKQIQKKCYLGICEIEDTQEDYIN